MSAKQTSQDEFINMMPMGLNEAVLVEICKKFDAFTIVNKKILEVSPTILPRFIIDRLSILTPILLFISNDPNLLLQGTGDQSYERATSKGEKEPSYRTFKGDCPLGINSGIGQEGRGRYEREERG